MSEPRRGQDPSVGGNETVPEPDGEDVDEPRAAYAAGRGVVDRPDDRAVLPADGANGARDGQHPAVDGHALERRAGGGRSRRRPRSLLQDDLAVGPQVDEQGVARPGREVQGRHPGRDVSADEALEVRGEVDPAPGMDRETEVRAP